MHLWWQRQQELRAKGLFCLEPLEQTFSWKSTQTHSIKRQGFPLTHEAFLTSTAAQGNTLRKGVTIDCARMPTQGDRGMNEDHWWFHLYVMFSRPTRMSDMLLLRPPPRDLLERGPPESIREALRLFDQKIQVSEHEAARLAHAFGIPLLPP